MVFQAGGDPQQRRFPAAGGTDERHELAAVDAERDAFERVRAIGEHHRQVGELERVAAARPDRVRIGTGIYGQRLIS